MKVEQELTVSHQPAARHVGVAQHHAASRVLFGIRAGAGAEIGHMRVVPGGVLKLKGDLIEDNLNEAAIAVWTETPNNARKPMPVVPYVAGMPWRKK